MQDICPVLYAECPVKCVRQADRDVTLAYDNCPALFASCPVKQVRRLCRNRIIAPCKICKAAAYCYQKPRETIEEMTE